MLNIACGQAPAVRPAVLNPEFDKKISKTIQFSVPTIGVEELQLIQNDVILLDARELEEYETSHLPNAIHIGYRNFSLEKLEEISKTKTLVLYCSIGYRSEKIGERLQAAGYQHVYNLYGSIFEWVNQGYPVFDKKEVTTSAVHTYNRNWSQWVNHPAVEKVW